MAAPTHPSTEAIRKAFKIMSNIYKLKRYLGNTHTLELHDTSNEKSGCQLDEIKVENRRWYDSVAQAKADLAYDNCAHCLTGSTH